MRHDLCDRSTGALADLVGRLSQHPLPTGVRRMIGELFDNRRGGVAIIFGIVLLPIIIGAGLAIDLGRAYAVKARLSYALDAAALAVGTSAGTDAELQQVMQQYFDANYPIEEVGVPATPVMTLSTSEIHLSATANLDTMLMSVIGIDNIAVASETVILKETTGLELVMVLDNTGSMSGSKITSLRDASQELVRILFGDNLEPELLKVGIVPFTGSVNIGAANDALLTALDPADFNPDFWRGCVEARPYPHDSSDTTPGVGGLWTPYLYPSNSSNDWPGISGDRGQIRGPNKYCPVQLLPLTSLRQDVDDTLVEMEARGVTHINYGAVWGWRVLSPEAPFTEGVAYSDEDWDKAIIIMTDGENYISSSSRGYSAYGNLSEGRLGTTNRSAAQTEMDNRLLEVCQGMKDSGILVYTITFQVSSSAIQDVMLSCATDAGKYFDSPSNSDLQLVFRTIAQQLTNLRIGR